MMLLSPLSGAGEGIGGPNRPAPIGMKEEVLNAMLARGAGALRKL